MDKNFLSVYFVLLCERIYISHGYIFKIRKMYRGKLNSSESEAKCQTE